jgi:hypothetical protein
MLVYTYCEQARKISLSCSSRVFRDCFVPRNDAIKQKRPLFANGLGYKKRYYFNGFAFKFITELIVIVCTLVGGKLL